MKISSLKKQLAILLCFLPLSGFLFASSINTTNSVNTISLVKFLKSKEDIRFQGEFDTSYIQIKKHKTKSDKKLHVNYNSLYTRFQKKNSNYELRISPIFTLYRTNSGEELYNNNLSKTCDKNKFFFKELFLRKYYGDHSFGFGLLPFSNNSFIEYQDDYKKRGEGLSILVDAVMPNFFYTYKINNRMKFKTGFGKYSWLDFLPKGDFIYEGNDETNIYWAVLDYSSEQIKSYSNFIYGDAKYFGKDVADVAVFGSGLVYDDSSRSGFSIYNTVGFSYYKNNNTHLKNEILKNNNIPFGTELLYPNNFAFDNKTYTGWSNQLGVRQDFDFKNKEFFINYEWFHTEGDWFSFNNGTPYRGNCNTMFNIRDDSHMFAVGAIPNENWIIKLFYVNAEFNEVSKVGLPPVTLPSEMALGNRKKEMEYTRFQIKYKF